MRVRRGGQVGPLRVLHPKGEKVCEQTKFLALDNREDFSDHSCLYHYVCRYLHKCEGFYHLSPLKTFNKLQKQKFNGCF